MIAYIFKDNRLVAMQDVTGWAAGKVADLCYASFVQGRDVRLSSRGRSICCVCCADMGECDIPEGKLSHGYCPACKAEVMQRVERITA